MKCDVCRGACCESITLNIKMADPDLQNFLELRSRPLIVDNVIHRNFKAPCRALTSEGRCSVYHTSLKPQLCSDFKPGSSECVNTARMQRTEAQFEAIRDEADEHWDGRKDVVMTADEFSKAIGGADGKTFDFRPTPVTGTPPCSV